MAITIISCAFSDAAGLCTSTQKAHENNIFLHGLLAHAEARIVTLHPASPSHGRFHYMYHLIVIRTQYLTDGMPKNSLPLQSRLHLTEYLQGYTNICCNPPGEKGDSALWKLLYPYLLTANYIIFVYIPLPSIWKPGNEASHMVHAY